MRHPRIAGFGHIDLTVTDGERSAEWWIEVLGFRLVAKQERDGFRTWTTFHPSGLAVSFVVHDRPASETFDERAVGLDHLALRVPDRAALHQWVEHLDQLGVAHSGIKDEIGGPLITVRDPDNLQIELAVFEPESLEGVKLL